MPEYQYDKVNNEFIIVSEQNKYTLPQIIWHILDYCPFKCPYCFSTKSNVQVNIKEFERYINVFKKLGVQKIDISGGEPLYYKYLPELIEALKSKDINITITSSGTGTESNVTWLIEHANYFSRIIFSLDGPDSEMHDKIRGGEGIFTRLLSLINTIKKDGNDKIRINTVITKLFLDPIYCEKIISIIHSIGPIEWCLIQPHPANKKKSYDIYNVTQCQYESIVNNLDNMNKRYNISILKRYIENYAGYWVLYPNGILKMHTDGKDDRFEIPFTEEFCEHIVEVVSNNKLWLPIKNRGEITNGTTKQN